LLRLAAVARSAAEVRRAEDGDRAEGARVRELRVAPRSRGLAVLANRVELAELDLVLVLLAVALVVDHVPGRDRNRLEAAAARAGRARLGEVHGLRGTALGTRHELALDLVECRRELAPDRPRHLLLLPGAGGKQEVVGAVERGDRRAVAAPLQRL